MKVFTKDTKGLAMFVLVTLIAGFAVGCVMLLARVWCETCPRLPVDYPGGILK